MCRMGSCSPAAKSPRAWMRRSAPDRAVTRTRRWQKGQQTTQYYPKPPVDEHDPGPAGDLPHPAAQAAGGRLRQRPQSGREPQPGRRMEGAHQRIHQTHSAHRCVQHRCARHPRAEDAGRAAAHEGQRGEDRENSASPRGRADRRQRNAAWRSSCALLLVVFVVALPPDTLLVAALGCPVEPLVHAPEPVDAPRIGRSRCGGRRRPRARTRSGRAGRGCRSARSGRDLATGPIRRGASVPGWSAGARLHRAMAARAVVVFDPVLALLLVGEARR